MTESSEHRYAVLVTYGTWAGQIPYSTKNTLQEAQALRRTAIQHGYVDAVIVENYEPARRGIA